jgi:hypothetical protein
MKSEAVLAVLALKLALSVTLVVLALGSSLRHRVEAGVVSAGSAGVGVVSSSSSLALLAVGVAGGK